MGKAIGMFAITNVDDIVVLALFFSQAHRPAEALRVVAGQYLGFIAILAVAALGALGVGMLPASALPYLGLLPLALGIRAGWGVWSGRRHPDAREDDAPAGGAAPGVLAVATVTFANGGDNIGVYVPVFANAGTGGLVTYCAVFLVMVAAWCAAGRFLATRPVVAGALSRWGHLLLPVVLVGIGLSILLKGGAFEL